jgi:oligosaccharide translocation protein RFT1
VVSQPQYRTRPLFVSSMESNKPAFPAENVESTSTEITTLLSTSAAGATLLIALQVGSRALTFIVNQLLLRYLSPELLGISTQLEVYLISVLFFARESLRVAIQRQADKPDESFVRDDQKRDPKGHVDGTTAAGRTQAIVNLAYISISLGVGFALFLGMAYSRHVRYNEPKILEVPYFQQSLNLYGLAAFWELLSEPCFVVVQQKSRFKIRATAESIATLLRCLTTCGSAIWAAQNGRDVGVLPFALGQVMYSISLFSVYCFGLWGITSKGGFSLILKPIHSRYLSHFSLEYSELTIGSVSGAYFLSYFSWPLLTLGGSLFTQSFVKLALTQGDTYLISIFASQTAQGAYALANNYGGLVARLILQPIEESSRNYFGKLLFSEDGRLSKDLILKARKDLNSLLRAYTLLSVIVLAVGPTIAPIILKIVAGSKWTEAGDVLATYCYYIPLLAINGLTEAFVSSVATKSQVDGQSMWMLAFSAGFATAVYVCLRVLDLGAKGLVWANTLNMAFRIAWSSSFIAFYMKRHGTRLELGTILPKTMTIAAAVGAYAVLTQVKSTFTGGILDVIKSGGVATALALCM